MTTISALTPKKTISPKTNKKQKSPDKNMWSGLMAPATVPHNRLRSREKVLVFFEGKANIFPKGRQEQVLTLKGTSRDRKADKFWMALNAWKASGSFPVSSLVDEPKQINR